MKSNLGATDIEICKTCLAMDVKLYSLQNKLLKDCNKVLTKFNKDVDGLPDYMCYKCMAFLIKSYNFIQKSIHSKNNLLNIHREYGVITKDLVNNINKSELSIHSNLTFNKVMPTTMYDMQYDEDLNKYNYIIITKNDNDDIMKYDEINDTGIHKSDVAHNFINLDGIKNDNCEVMINDDDNSNIGKDDEDYKPDDGSYDSEENVTLNRIKNKAKIHKVTVKKPAIKSKIKKSHSSKAEEINLEKYFKIVRLTLDEQIAEREKMKESPAYRDALYRCEVCYRTYMNPDSFKQHVGQHHPSGGEHECPVCKIRYTSDTLARCHATRVHGKKFYCKICPKRFGTASMAKKHHQRHEGRTYKCSDCDFSSIHESAVFSHIKCHSHCNRFSCSECGHKFRSEKGLKLHAAKIHGIKQTSKVGSQYTCYNCGTNFISEVMLQNHSINCQMKANSEDNNEERSESGRYELNTTEDHYPIQCEHCGTSMNTRKDHYSHVRKYHRNELDSYQPVISAVCTTCGRGFQNVTKLHMHELRHRGTATVRCPHCPRMFYDKYQLGRHIGVHSDDRPYTCTECGKTFKHKGNMDRHQQVHSSAFPHECNMCGKRFSYTSSRNLHIKTVHYKMPQPPRKKRNTKCARNPAANSYDDY